MMLACDFLETLGLGKVVVSDALHLAPVGVFPELGAVTRSHADEDLAVAVKSALGKDFMVLHL